MQSTWKMVPGFERYEVSSDGQVRSRLSGRLLKPAGTRYLMVTLYRDGANRRTRCVHHLVTEAFLGEKGDEVVRHLDGNKRNNALSNLAYGTPSENSLDTLAHGTHTNAFKQACLRGHVYTDENTAIRSDGRRYCKRCNADRVRRLSARRKDTK